MTTIARIDDEVVLVDDFLRTLKLNGQFAGLVEQVVRDRLAVHAARRQGIAPSHEEIQERADQFRRALGLHRAADTNRYLTALGVSIDEFEQFITDGLCQEKMLAQVGCDQAVQEYFAQHSPRFESVEVRHLLIDTEGKAREMLSVLREDPDSVDDLAQAHSVADQGSVTGAAYSQPPRNRAGPANPVNRITRGSLRPDVEAKVFNAGAGEVLGPFPSAEGNLFELFLIRARHPATLDDDTAAEVRRLLHEQWLGARAQEHVIAAS